MNDQQGPNNDFRFPEPQHVLHRADLARFGRWITGLSGYVDRYFESYQKFQAAPSAEKFNLSYNFRTLTEREYCMVDRRAFIDTFSLIGRLFRGLTVAGAMTYTDMNQLDMRFAAGIYTDPLIIDVNIPDYLSAVEVNENCNVMADIRGVNSTFTLVAEAPLAANSELATIHFHYISRIRCAIQSTLNATPAPATMRGEVVLRNTNAVAINTMVTFSWSAFARLPNIVNDPMIVAGLQHCQRQSIGYEGKAHHNPVMLANDRKRYLMEYRGHNANFSESEAINIVRFEFMLIRMMGVLLEARFGV